MQGERWRRHQIFQYEEGLTWALFEAWKWCGKVGQRNFLAEETRGEGKPKTSLVTSAESFAPMKISYRHFSSSALKKRQFPELSARVELRLWKFLDVERKKRGGEHGLGLSPRPVSALGKQPPCRHVLIHPPSPPHPTPVSPRPPAGSVLSGLHVRVHTASAELW